MQNITNSKLIEELRRGSGIQQSINQTPNTLGNQVIPVMEVNPKLLRILSFSKRGTLNNATFSTIFTTPSVATDTYITGCTLAMIKDVTSTATVIAVTVVVDTVINYLIEIPSISATVHSESLSISFPFPLKIDRNTTINVIADTGVANIAAHATVQGFYVDNPNI